MNRGDVRLGRQPSRVRDRICVPTDDAVPPPVICTGGGNPLLFDVEGGASGIGAYLLKANDISSLQNGEEGSSGFVGSLRAMCSEDEIIDKQRTSTTNDLERLETSDPDTRVVNKYLAVKGFQRSDANKTFKAEDVRSPVWCRQTVHNMLGLQSTADVKIQPWIFNRAERYTLLDVYNFFRDRFRAVWQDLTVQHCTTHQGYIQSLEIGFRFLSASGMMLCEQEGFDSVQNWTLMSTCLEKLLRGYEDVRYYRVSHSNEPPKISGLSDADVRTLRDIMVYSSKCESEFWGYKLLTHLDSSRAYLDAISSIPQAHDTDPNVLYAIEARHAFRDGNGSRFFKLIRSGSFIQGAILSRHIASMRERQVSELYTKSLRISPRIPIESTNSILGYVDNERNMLLEFCASHSIEIVQVEIGDTSVTKSVDFRNATFNVQTDLPLKRHPGSIKTELVRFQNIFESIDRIQLIDPDYPEDHIEFLKNTKIKSTVPVASKVSGKTFLGTAVLPPGLELGQSKNTGKYMGRKTGGRRWR
eukprot:GHVO01011440.1.p1 GENE.GHVO01011440.1~~GHVO01011440.1.p1  ORF type:complete len:529 (+),score=45.91 GHVO01011440.1:378-1964(+)